MMQRLPKKPRKSKGGPRLLTHRTVATMVDLDSETLRRWVKIGEFPEPHSVICNTWFYEAEIIEHFLTHRLWPAGTRFRPKVRKIESRASSA